MSIAEVSAGGESFLQPDNKRHDFCVRCGKCQRIAGDVHCFAVIAGKIRAPRGLNGPAKPNRSRKRMTGVLIAANQNFSISQPLHAGNNKLRHIQTKQALCRFLHLRGMRGSLQRGRQAGRSAPEPRSAG